MILHLIERFLLWLEMAFLQRRISRTVSTEEFCSVVTRMSQVQERLLTGARV